MLTDGGNRICSPELLAQIAEVIDSAILITRFGSLGQFDHRIIYANPAFSRLTGYKPKEIIGRSPDVLCDPRTSGDRMLEFYSRCSQGGRFNVQMDSFQKQGSELKLNVEVTPVIDETQGIHYYILMLKDLSGANHSIMADFPQNFVAQTAYSPYTQQPHYPTNTMAQPQPNPFMYHPQQPQQQMQQPFVQQPQPIQMQNPFASFAQYQPPQHNPVNGNAYNGNNVNGHFNGQGVNGHSTPNYYQPPENIPAMEEPKFDNSYMSERFWQSPNNDITPHTESPFAAPPLQKEVSVRDIMQAASMSGEDLPQPKNKAEISTDESIAEYCKTQFLANMSHDLRTPLNAIIGFSEVIKDQLFGPIENPRYVSYANDIFRSGQELFATISEIMELSEIQPDEKVTDDDKMNICDVIESVIDVLSPKAFEADVKIVKTFDARDLRLTGDRRKIKQALAGVIGNSIKYSSSGSKIEVSVSTTEKGDLKISVHAKSATILGKSAMMGTITRKMESDYPEISLAKRFVEAHDGKFGIFNSATAGTEISITLPGSRLSMEPEKKTLLKVIS